MTDIEAPYITEMNRKGHCDEYDDYYGISRNSDDSEGDRDCSEWDD